MRELCFVKFMIMAGGKNTLMVSTYKVLKETDKRVYYYEFFDSESTEDEAIFVKKTNINNLVIENRGERCIMASNWCYKEDLELVKKELQDNLKSHLESLMNSLSIYSERNRDRFEA